MKRAAIIVSTVLVACAQMSFGQEIRLRPESKICQNLLTIAIDTSGSANFEDLRSAAADLISPEALIGLGVQCVRFAQFNAKTAAARPLEGPIYPLPWPRTKADCPTAKRSILKGPNDAAEKKCLEAVENANQGFAARWAAAHDRLSLALQEEMQDLTFQGQTCLYEYLHSSIERRSGETVILVTDADDSCARAGNSPMLATARPGGARLGMVVVSLKGHQEFYEIDDRAARVRAELPPGVVMEVHPFRHIDLLWARESHIAAR